MRATNVERPYLVTMQDGAGLDNEAAINGPTPLPVLVMRVWPMALIEEKVCSPQQG